MPEFRRKPFISVRKTIDRPDPIVVVEAQDYGPDHIVQPRTEAAAGYNAAGEF